MRLDTQPSRARRLCLGQVEALRHQVPLTFEFDRQVYELSSEPEWTLTPKICPHLLGPLQPIEDDPSEVRCPWHGYRFSKVTGECVEPSTARCRLRPLPTILEDHEMVWIIARSEDEP